MFILFIIIFYYNYWTFIFIMTRFTSLFKTFPILPTFTLVFYDVTLHFIKRRPSAIRVIFDQKKKNFFMISSNNNFPVFSINLNDPFIDYYCTCDSYSWRSSSQFKKEFLHFSFETFFDNVLKQIPTSQHGVNDDVDEDDVEGKSNKRKKVFHYKKNNISEEKDYIRVYSMIIFKGLKFGFL